MYHYYVVLIILYISNIASSDCPSTEIIETNEAILKDLHQLLNTSFFKYYKSNLNHPCPFWKESRECSSQNCAITVEDNVPEELEQADQDLSALVRSSIMSPFSSESCCKFTDKDFCVHDDLSGIKKSYSFIAGEYVDLTMNPERFTGYQGMSSARVWASIYQENCFDFAPELKKVPFSAAMDSICVEKKAFYRLVSGLHASISAHIAWQFYYKELGTWGPNYEIYKQRLKDFPERIENIHYNYMILFRAIRKASTYLSKYTVCTGDVAQDKKTRKMIHRTLKKLKDCSFSYEEMDLFSSAESKDLKSQFKEKFRNVSKIMECVGCDKCRMWGLATALKILFSYNDSVDYQLRRVEVVALMNTFGKFSESLHAIRYFEEQKQESSYEEQKQESSYEEQKQESSYEEQKQESSYEKEAKNNQENEKNFFNLKTQFDDIIKSIVLAFLNENSRNTLIFFLVIWLTLLIVLNLFYKKKVKTN